MKKANAWDLVNKEAGAIISSIEKGEIKTQKAAAEKRSAAAALICSLWAGSGSAAPP